MPVDQYYTLINYIDYLIEKKASPAILVRLGPVNITKELLRFTFWVFHKEMYGTRPIKTYILEFMKEAFSDFDKWEIDSIRSKFAVKQNINKDDFLPPIIKKYL